jgi:hypothetical protein
MTSGSEIYDDDQPTQAAAAEQLPDLVTVSTAFSARLPSQRVLDMLARLEGVGFGELAERQPFRIVAFRALMRDYPSRDPASVWAHAYDVEVEVAEAMDPTNGKSTTRAPRFADSGG